ncbi:hypothetical protein [Morganella psychrotolerans]|uniref:Uncharacterized protein n=1 Tax=Morganella psychrotolerans TaxID=368603 RepID=A0A1B8H8A8_9GAMM|nr:hypothetical protein [Morganella psychrotolerans]OBU05280.1 hypothetical protein AYY18_20135 [Morganella psychrotolerans]
MSGHPHADLMANAAEIAKTDKEWYRHFEFKTCVMSSWSQLVWASCFDPNVQYRLKPRTIDINGHQVPEPVRELPQDGDWYYLANVTDGGSSVAQWNNCKHEREWLGNGLVHATEEAAEAHVAALLSFTQK